MLTASHARLALRSSRFLPRRVRPAHGGVRADGSSLPRSRAVAASDGLDDTRRSRRRHVTRRARSPDAPVDVIEPTVRRTGGGLFAAVRRRGRHHPSRAAVRPYAAHHATHAGDGVEPRLSWRSVRGVRYGRRRVSLVCGSAATQPLARSGSGDVHHVHPRIGRSHGCGPRLEATLRSNDQRRRRYREHASSDPCDGKGRRQLLTTAQAARRGTLLRCRLGFAA